MVAKIISADDQAALAMGVVNRLKKPYTNHKTAKQDIRLIYSLIHPYLSRSCNNSKLITQYFLQNNIINHLMRKCNKVYESEKTISSVFCEAICVILAIQKLSEENRVLDDTDFLLIAKMIDCPSTTTQALHLICEMIKSPRDAKLFADTYGIDNIFSIIHEAKEDSVNNKAKLAWKLIVCLVNIAKNAADNTESDYSSIIHHNVRNLIRMQGCSGLNKNMAEYISQQLQLLEQNRSRSFNA